MKNILALTLIAAILATAGCNTIAGVGRDVRAAGDAVTSGAESARN